MSPVTRRGALSLLPATIAAAVPTVAAAMPAPEHPWDAARRLARELADVLDLVEGGSEFAIIYPRSHSAYPTMFGSIEAYEEAKVFVRPELRQATEEHARAWKAFLDRYDEWADCIPGEAPDGLEGAWMALSQEEQQALAALCSIRCRNKAEEEFRASYLSAHYATDGDWGDRLIRLLLASMVGEAQS